MNLFGQLVGLLERGISPTQSLYLHRTTQHRKTRTHIHASSGSRTHDPSIRAAEDSTCLRPEKIKWNTQNYFPFCRIGRIGIPQWYSVGWSGVRFSAGAGNFSLHRRVQTGSGAYLASYPMGNRGCFPGGKAAGAWSWSLPSI